MTIKREREWGTLQYDTSEHRFSCIKTNGRDAIPYVDEPVLLNCDLTLKCNMNCRHCVAKDFQGEACEDLTLAKETIDAINNSHFMVVVITGGEPLLNEYQERLIALLQGIKGKGLIIDTNGTIAPSESLVNVIRKTATLVRVSWDSPRPQDEICLRQKRLTKKDDNSLNLEYYYKKITMIGWFRKHGIDLAVQSIIHKRNLDSIADMPVTLREYSVKKWYLQRFIPSYLEARTDKFSVDNNKYHQVITKLTKLCHKERIECIAKRDTRHNSVFLLVGNGLVYTQGERPGEKILLGDIRSNIPYFRYVSAPDHADRYYG